MRFTNGISEIVLIVNDVNKAAAFYRDIVGLIPKTDDTDEWAWFWSGEENNSSRIALHKGKLLYEEYSPLPEGQRWGKIHFALEVDKDNLQKALDKLKENKITIYGPVDFEWMNAKSYYFYDPDNNLVEYWTPNN